MVDGTKVSGRKQATRENIRSLVPPFVWELWKETRYTLNGNGSGRKPDWRQVAAGPLAGRFLYTEDRTMGSAMLRGVYDQDLFAALGDLLPNCEVVLDIGAYVGYNTLSFAALAPNAQVIAFEPSQANLTRLQMNIERNSDLSKRIQIKPVAVGAQEGSLELMVSVSAVNGLGSMSYVLSPTDNMHARRSQDYADFKPQEIRMVTLDQESQQFPGRVGLVKIDVEGAEVDVIEGGKTFIQTHRPVLIIEIHSVALGIRLSKLLAELGYSPTVIDDQSRNRCVVKALPLSQGTPQNEFQNEQG